jgi:DNA-binding HxlR family transcriptional regulator
MSLADLEQTAALRILVLLHKRRSATRTQLIKAVNASTTTLYTALTKLKKLGLIQEKKDKTFPFTAEVTLSQKGQGIADLLVKIEQMLGN